MRPARKRTGSLPSSLSLVDAASAPKFPLSRASSALIQSGEVPFGVELNVISMQSDAVTVAIRGFVVSLVEAIAIVVVVLVLFMGVRSGLLIGFILFMTICASFVVMNAQGIVLERISLGALIIALGMLVDNAIVVTDGMQVKIQAGVDRLKAAKDTVAQSMMPLLGATVIAVLAFAAIGTSDDNTGEYCRSLYQVILISLIMSWITAVTVTPLLCYMFIKPATKKDGDADEYSGALFQGYKRLLILCLKRRTATCVLMVALLALSLFGFTRIEQSFFPSSTRPQFMVDIWLQEGTHIDETVSEVSKVEDFLMSLDSVTGISTFVGRGGNRFLLTYTPEKQYPSYAQMLVDVEDYKAIDGLMGLVRDGLGDVVPQARVFPQKFVLGPAKPGKIQARFSGPDPQTLRELAQKAIDRYYADGDLTNIHIDWRSKVKVMEAVLSEAPARANGITRPDLARAMQEAFEGTRVGVYREGDKLLPVISRAPLDERDDVGKARDLLIWSPVAQRMIPMSQVVSGFQTMFEDPIVNRRNRQRTIIAKADPAVGNASVIFNRVREDIESIELPPGYSMEWGGEYEDSGNAQAGLAATIPLFIGIMILVTVFLFNSIRQPLIIWLCVPLAIIGVTAGLLMTGQPFGFMPLLGLLSLIGMLIKNAIVLIDQINFESAEGKDTYTAIVDSGVSRLRPVMMAASTTVLGMIPLVADAFFVSMAITIMFGLAFASILTLIIVPVLYSMFYKATG
jgi:multidrug efflux pump subunit AcrB